jgi:PIN domain nuclease of toxin-antitoxin system
MERLVGVAAVLLDTHVVHWWSAEPRRVSSPAQKALENADELVVAAISWYELAWLARHERIVVNVPVRSWLQGLAAQLRTIGVTPAIADTAVALPSSFPGDPADRLIYATAIEHGLKLVTKDQAIRDHDRLGSAVIW